MARRKAAKPQVGNGKLVEDGDGTPEGADLGVEAGDGDAGPEPEFTLSSFDPGADDAGDGGSGGTGDGEKRKRKQYRKRRPRVAPDAAENLAVVILGLRKTLAAVTGVGEMELDPAEAKALGDALARVQALYSRSLLTEPAAAWMNFLITWAGIDGPRLLAYRNRRRAEEAKQTGSSVSRMEVITQ